MKKYPNEIKSGKGSVLNQSKYYKGLAITLNTAYGEVALIVEDMQSIKIQAALLMHPGFEVDESKVQEVYIFGKKSVTEFN